MLSSEKAAERERERDHLTISIPGRRVLRARDIPHPPPARLAAGLGDRA